MKIYSGGRQISPDKNIADIVYYYMSSDGCEIDHDDDWSTEDIEKLRDVLQAILIKRNLN